MRAKVTIKRVGGYDLKVEEKKLRTVAELKLPPLHLYLRLSDVQNHRDMFGCRACDAGIDWLSEQIAAQGRKKSWRLDWPTLLAILASRNYGARENIAWAMECGLIPRVNFARSDLERASLDGASLDVASLRNASLDGASLRNASLDGASLDGASLVGASLDGASLVGASLDGASLRNASLRNASLRNASLRNASLVGANLSGCSRWSHDAAIPGWELRNGVLVRATKSVHMG